MTARRIRFPHWLVFAAAGPAVPSPLPELADVSRADEVLSAASSGPAAAAGQVGSVEAFLQARFADLHRDADPSHGARSSFDGASAAGDSIVISAAQWNDDPGVRSDEWSQAPVSAQGFVIEILRFHGAEPDNSDPPTLNFAQTPYSIWGELETGNPSLPTAASDAGGDAFPLSDLLAGPGSPDLSAVADLGGFQMLCGCAACVAARKGETSTFKAEAVQVAADNTPSPPVADAAAAAGGAFTAGAATEPTYALNALLAGSSYKWGSLTAGTAAVVTYSFLTSVPGYYPSGAGERTHFVAMNAVQQQAAKDALALYSEAANITFVLVAAGTGSINFGTADLGNGIGGWAYYPRSYSGSNDNTAAGDVWITNRYASYNNPTPGSWEYQTYIHEIGHAIGMKHPGNYNAGGGGTPGPYLPTGEDSHQYTVMSYYSGPSYGSTEPITPQVYDVATIQYLYGVNSNTRSGNDTYTFSSSLQVKTIWDGGGTDTFDASSQTSAVGIDLHPGAFSSIAGTNNIAIAFGAAIENAIGSNYNDTLKANDAGGTLDGRVGNDALLGGAAADRLIGGAGTDTLTGGGGADVFAFAAGDSSAVAGKHDLITDFTVGADKIDLTGIDADTSTSGILDAFHFIAMEIFDGLAAALDYFFDSVRGVTVLQGDVNGDKVADFAIDLTGNRALSYTDFTAGSLRAVTPLNLTGDGNANTLIGDILDDQLYGMGGNDTLKGLAGNDVLDGGSGADRMEGGDGDDIYVVDDAGDVVAEGSSAPGFTAPAGWTIKGTADFNKDGETDVVVTSGTANQIWLLKDGAISAKSDLTVFSGYQLQGIADVDGDGNKDALYLYKDNALQVGLLLNGTTVGGTRYVTVTPDQIDALTAKNAGTDTVQSSITYTLATGLEKLTLTGSGNINGSGNEADNVIAGNAGNNIITGNGGADVLTGNGGADRFVFAANFSRDTITDFHPGEDIIQMDHSTFASVFDLLAHAVDDGHGNVVITANGADAITVKSMTVATLQQHPSDFLLV